MLTLPCLIIGLILNILFSSLFHVGGPTIPLMAISIVILILGVAIWVWSVILILARVTKRDLITSRPYSLVIT